MYLIDLLNWFGRRKRLRLFGRLLLFFATKISFYMVVRIAGRRIVTAFAGAPAMLLGGLKIKDTVKDPRLLYKAMAYTIETMGMDTLCLFADMSLEAESCGCQVHFDDDRVPSVITHPVKTVDDITELRIPDPYQDGRMPVFLEAMRLMQKNYTMLKIGEVCGPFTLATSLGGTDIYMDVRRNPQKVKRLLEYCEKVAIRYAQALIKSGADIILIAEPAGSQLSASAYEDFSLSYTKNIIKALDRTCILHICGKAGHIIEKMCQSGAAVLSIDDVDMAQVKERVPRRIVIAGNISPQKFSKSSAEELESETLNLLDTMKTRKDFLVAPGCDLSPQTPLENILAFTRAARVYSRK